MIDVAYQLLDADLLGVEHVAELRIHVFAHLLGGLSALIDLLQQFVFEGCHALRRFSRTRLFGHDMVQ